MGYPGGIAAPEGRRFQLSGAWDEALVIFSTRRAWRSGGKGGRGKSPAQKRGAACNDRLAIERISGVFIGTTATVPIKRESPLRQSADRKKPAVGLSWPQILELKGWGATLLSSRVE